jgi:hypothetical protein
MYAGHVSHRRICCNCGAGGRGHDGRVRNGVRTKQRGRAGWRKAERNKLNTRACHPSVSHCLLFPCVCAFRVVCPLRRRLRDGPTPSMTRLGQVAASSVDCRHSGAQGSDGQRNERIPPPCPALSPPPLSVCLFVRIAPAACCLCRTVPGAQRNCAEGHRTRRDEPHHTHTAAMHGHTDGLCRSARVVGSSGAVSRGCCYCRCCCWRLARRTTAAAAPQATGEKPHKLRGKQRGTNREIGTYSSFLW